MKAVRKCGTVQLTGVYGGLYNMFPLGAFFSRNVTLKMGQAPARAYMNPLYEQIVKGEIDSTSIITHKLKLEDAAKGYHLFNKKEDECIKVILNP